MKRLTGLLLCVAAAGLIGCGDSGAECGEGTELDDDGYCVPTGTPVTCTDGTMLDEATNTCVIDPASCQGGTVLIGNECVDPTDGLTVDAVEAAEPNGLGINGEVSQTPAGDVMLKPIGQKLVLQGNLNPQADRDEDGAKESDIDAFVIEASGPALLEISVDGVGGISGAFVAFGLEDGLEDWQRYGVNLTGDTSKRQVYLPVGGVYLLGIADTRSLTLGEPAGDANNKYYVTVEQKAIPAATAVTLTANEVNHIGQITDGEVDFVTAELGLGFNDIDLTSFNSDFEGSLVAMQGARIRSITDEVKSASGDSPAEAFYGGVTTGSTSLFVIDHVINTASTAVDYKLHIKSRTAAALSTTGAGVDQTNAGLALTSFDAVTYWYFDVNATNQLTGIDLAWNVPFSGALVDENGFFVARFTNFNAATRFQNYKGLIRTNAPGRYYFIGFAPAPSTTTTVITATSTITPMAAPDALAFEQVLTDVAPGTFNAKPYRYVVGTEPWQQFIGGADAASGGASVRAFGADSYGRLGSYTTLNAAGTPTVVTTVDGSPLVNFTAAASDTNERGLITPGLPDTLLVVASTTTGAGTFDLTTDQHPYNNEGDHAPPYTTTHAAQDIDNFFFQDYLIKTTPGSTVTITVTPDALEDLVIEQLDTPENVINDADVGLTGDPETLEVIAGPSGYVAWRVYEYDFIQGTFEIEIEVAAPTPAYTIAAGTTAWSNACNGGNDVTPADRDDGSTAAITIPAGFSFFAGATTAVRINSNGWLTFNVDDVVDSIDASIESPFPDDLFLPDGVIAPYWNDLVNARICTKTSGTKFIVQWRGTDSSSGDAVATQAILDTADDTIEFVYAPYHRADGEFGSAGVESSTASQGVTVFYHEQNAVSPGTSKKLTPM